ncbi:hypothetical protein BDZ89DRAFT_1144154 [Hymenopellis radicata]|nr:hypothetical protein BDZ89DRAFT_1144154 [Hymenopellis radicata]
MDIIRVVPPVSFVTTIHSFPAEVLSQIFLFYLGLCQCPASADAFTDIVVAQNAHRTILLVCRRWHTVALADPLLWTTIPIIAAHSGRSGSWQERTEYQRALQRRIRQTKALSLRLLFYLGSHATDSGMSSHWRRPS